MRNDLRNSIKRRSEENQAHTHTQNETLSRWRRKGKMTLVGKVENSLANNNQK